MREWYIENKCTHGPGASQFELAKIDPEFENMHCLVALPSSNWFLGSCLTQIHDLKGVVELLHQTPLLGSLQQISICFNVLVVCVPTCFCNPDSRLLRYNAHFLVKASRIVTASSQIKSASSDSWASSSRVLYATVDSVDETGAIVIEVLDDWRWRFCVMDCGRDKSRVQVF